ncbi:MAG: Peptide methionine sulfoxide reductase MsrA [Anaerolineae bacterium]|nr:Peptide methionine sulfoxide reductase MsrA [Anaerolineae bacterium]
MIRSRVGYTGGTKLNPTYYSLGNHTESLQIEFDPTRITYEQLLDIFWNSHNPTQKTWSTQYKAAVFVHNQEQARLAEASKIRMTAEKTGRWFNRTIHTEILPAQTFYLAEDYHQKYLLQHSPVIWGEIQKIYRGDMMGWVNSTAAARLNGYVGGYASAEQLAGEIDSLGLSSQAQEVLWQTVRRFNR